MLIVCCQDIPKPGFMTSKEEDDWTEEEVKVAQEYESRVKELQEEREKYRKVSHSSMYATMCFVFDIALFHYS